MGQSTSPSGSIPLTHALWERERHFYRIFELSNDAIFILDPQRDEIVDANPKACHFLGYRRAELLQLPIAVIHPAGSLERFLDFVAQVVRDEQGYANEVTYLAKSDEIKHAEVSASVIEVGGRTCLFTLIHDITECTRVEEALRRSAERLEVLHRIDQTILAAYSPQEITQATLEHIQQLVPCETANVAFFDTDNLSLGQTIPLSGIGRAPNTIALSERDEATAALRTLRRGESLLIRRLDGAPQRDVVVKLLPAAGLASCLIVPLMVQQKVIGTLNLGSTRRDAFGREHIEVAREVADSLAIAVQHAWLFESVKEKRQHLQAVTARLADVEEAERKRLAQKLHDRVGQSLTVLGINLNIIQNGLSASSDRALIEERLQDSLSLVEELAERTRDVMAELRPPVLDDYGLAAALRWYGEQFSKRTGIRVQLHCQESACRLPAVVENSLFRIAQETLINVAKHARACQVALRFEFQEDKARLSVSDDGVGFSPARRPNRKDQLAWGLITIQERAEAIGGQLWVKSAPGQGTEVVVEVGDGAKSGA